MNIESFYNTDEIKRFYFPGKIFVGKGVFQKAIQLSLESGSNIAIVIDSFFDDAPFIKEQLEKLSGCIVGKYVVSGAPIAQEVSSFVGKMSARPDVILSIGGGSATDFAKAVVAYYLYGTFDAIGLTGVWPDKNEEKKPLLVSVPTTAGSGAEASRYYVTYDKNDHHKVFGKSWSLIADWIMLDPVFLKTVPSSVLVSCAFDVFVHFFETFICKYERSNAGQMLSLFGIARLMTALDTVINKNDPTDATLSDLMEMSTFAGMAISNVRTGNMHEAAGALLERTDLSHPETLFVFFRQAVEQYMSDISDREFLLLAHLNISMPDAGLTSLNDVIAWWETVFETTGLTDKIKSSLGERVEEFDEIREHIYQRVFTDKVWVGKESPTPLTDQDVVSLVNKSLDGFVGN